MNAKLWSGVCGMAPKVRMMMQTSLQTKTKQFTMSVAARFAHSDTISPLCDEHPAHITKFLDPLTRPWSSTRGLVTRTWVVRIHSCVSPHSPQERRATRIRCLFHPTRVLPRHLHPRQPQFSDGIPQGEASLFH